MSTENEILAEVETLKAKFTDTKSLYREVCALLFFRHGITPTTNKLYQYVRKGTMSTPADALGKFWDELRTKARVEIDHPDLPEELKGTAAEAIAGIWRHATASARGELEGLRIEARAELEQVRRELHQTSAAAELERVTAVGGPKGHKGARVMTIADATKSQKAAKRSKKRRNGAEED